MFVFARVFLLVPVQDWTRVRPDLLHRNLYLFKLCHTSSATTPAATANMIEPITPYAG